jgi:hypothetical protein
MPHQRPAADALSGYSPLYSANHPKPNQVSPPFEQGSLKPSDPDSESYAYERAEVIEPGEFNRAPPARHVDAPKNAEARRKGRGRTA